MNNTDEYNIKLTIKDMDIIIDALKYYPSVKEPEENRRLLALGKLLYEESKIYKQRSEKYEKEANA